MISEVQFVQVGHLPHPLRGVSPRGPESRTRGPWEPGRVVLSLNRFALEVSDFPKRSLAPQCVALFCTIGASRRRHERDPSTRRAQRGPQIHNDQQYFCQVNPTVTTTSAFDHLLPVQFSNINTRRRLTARLYDPSGTWMSRSLHNSMSCCGCRGSGINWKSTRLDRRTLQYSTVPPITPRSGGRSRVRLSQGRAPTRGHARAGRAVDFRLPGVEAATLAAYLRTVPRVGVGVYTHPKPVRASGCA